MAVTLKVTPETLKALAKEYQEHIDSIQNQLNLIDNNVKGTRKYWLGDASNKHMEKYMDIQSDIKKTMNTVNKDPKDLLSIAGLYTEAEDTNIKTVSALPTDAII